MAAVQPRSGASGLMIPSRSLRSDAAPRAKSLLLGSGFYSLLRTMAPSRRLAILRYHAICQRDAGYAEPGICVSPAAFEQHVAYLAAHYHVLPLPDAVAALRRGTTLPRNAVAITFDDGYADNLGAAEILARHGLAATFYITAGCLAGGGPFWPAELRILVKAITHPQIQVHAAGSPVTLPLTTPEERTAAVSKLTRLFKGHTIPIREALRDQLRRLANLTTIPSPMLGWTDVAAMYKKGMVIGSHTLTHPNLPNAGASEAHREITESKAIIEDRLGAPVTMFSYPNGGAERYMTRDVARLVKDAGYEAATTSRNAFAGPKSDPFALERIQVAEPLENLIFALEVERFAFRPKPRVGEMQ
jgi:peptidoglycan/xylan/chitin deacetylase (PgdA/CDA1 family)